jgi:cardiolipin synthase
VPFVSPRLVSLAAVIAIVMAGGCASHPPGHPYILEPMYSVHDPAFTRTIGHLLSPPLVNGNRITTLVNGDRYFPQMLAAINAAQRTINLETYVYWSGDVAEQFCAALSEAARRGVTVNVMLDAYGAGKMNPEFRQRLKDAGVKLAIYHPLQWYNVTSAAKMNNRTHRKLLIIDGNVGFTGGAGIAQEWTGDAQDEHHWRDTHYKIEGPVVADLQSAFTDNWIEITGEVLHGPDYYPPLQDVGPLPAQVFKSGPEGGSASMQLLFLLSINAARESICISTPYFVPDDLTMSKLIAARQRGVRVQVIVPGPHIDQTIVTYASRQRWEDLLEADIEIYEYQPSMYHTKLLVVDGVWVSIGSSNFDNRSFSLNDEANLNVFDADFAAEQLKNFQADLQRSKRISREKFLKRSFWNILQEHMASVLEKQL